MKDKFIKVVVTDEDGNEAEDETLSKVGVDASFDVELVDDYGLQDDGTGIIGDKLTVTYGATFGVPTNVSWYKDGKVVATNSVGDDVNDGLTRTISASNWGTGVYKVTITNKDGEMAETNEIEITDKEEAAEIVGFTLEDDYTDGYDVDYDTQDKRAVATITMNKNYVGKFRIYRSTDTTFKTPLATDTLETTIAEPRSTAADATAAGAPADEVSVLTTNQATNYQVLRAGTLGSGYGYIAPDGTVTYKYVLDDTGVERGASYVVTFDQDSISSDKPGTGIANVGPVAEAPYVVAPDAIAVTKVSAAVKPEITFLDENGDALAWFGYTQTNPTTGTDPNNIGTDATTGLDDVKVASAQVYAATNKTTDPKASGVSIIQTGVNNRNTIDNVVKGVWTCERPAGEEAYFFATVKLTKGIFAKDAVEITSEAQPTAQPAATNMNILEDKTTASSAVVSFENLRADGTVYIARGQFKGDGTNTAAAQTQIVNIADIVENFDPADSTSFVASAPVEAGAKSVTVENAVGTYTGAWAGNIPNSTGYYTEDGTVVGASYVTGKTYYTDDYVAIFVPDDQVNYGQIVTDDQVSKSPYALDDDNKEFNWLRNAAVPASITYDKTTRATIEQSLANNTLTITGTKLLAKDQFGNTVHNAVATPQDVTSVTFTPDPLNNTAQGAKAKYTVGANGVVRIVMEVRDGVVAAVGDQYTISILGSTITLKAIGVVSDDNRTDAQSCLVWDAKFGSDNLIDNDDAVALAGLTLTVGTADGKTTITVSGTKGTVAAESSDPTKSTVSVSGRVATVTYAANGAHDIVVTISTDTFVRTVTYNGATAAGNDPVGLTLDSSAITAAP